MKAPIILTLILTAASLQLHAADGWHTFTNKEGKTFVGRVLSMDEEANTVAVLVKDSNRRSVIDLAVLSDEDIEYLSDWDPDEAEGGEAEGLDDTAASSRLYPRSKEEIRAGIREIEKRDPPAGIDSAQQKTVNQLNVYRFLCGVPHEVEADAKMVEQATDAAKACKEHGSLSHDLGRSTNICNLAQGATMFSSVAQYMNDAGDNNRENRGHRRWCLNPPMGKTGFGEEGDFSAMVSMDHSGRAKTRDSWAYPGKGFFPLEYMHGNGWSLYLPEDAPPADKLKVEVYKLQERPDKAFASGAEIPGKALPVEFVRTYGNAINFEPQPEPITDRGIYWVRVTGGGVREGYVVELH